MVSISPNAPISINELTNLNIVENFGKATAATAATYDFEIRFNYNIESQTKYPGLAEAVFTAEGLNEDGAEYFCSSVLPSLSEMGSTYITSLLLVSNECIKQLGVEIVADGSLVENVGNGQYKASNKKSYSLGGHSIPASSYTE